MAHDELDEARCLLLPGNPVAALVSMLNLGLPLVAPFGRGGSASLAPFLVAEGLVRVPAEMSCLKAGARVAFLPFPEAC
jgi:molybdopterin biosynthesis enzyme